jgi:ABC-2 type transport system ATP-binding protein
LTTEGLSKSYARKPAVRDLSLNVGQGQIFGLLGPNGSGKTTTLGMILGAVHADRGSYCWFGQGSSGRERRRIGALIEQPCFYPWLSGRANLEVFAAIKGLAPATIDEQLTVVGLEAAKNQSFQTYSLGMKQRLGLAAALLGKPDVLVLDEPTNGVDAQGIAQIRTLISAFARTGGTVILASHLLDEVEKVCSHVAIMKDGAILKIGATKSILATNGWVELGAASLNDLEAALSEVAPAARCERRGDWIELIGADLSTAELNSRLAKRGLVLSHLVQRQPSLESQYLHLVGKGDIQ